jgi:uncharacterized protein (TIGR03435 family)
VIRNTLGGLSASSGTIEDLCRTFTSILQRPVIDRTGLAGRFEFRLRWAPAIGENSAFGPVLADGDASLPSLFTAVEEQLGLRLEAATTTIDVFVVDAAHRPTPN